MGRIWEFIEELGLGLGILDSSCFYGGVLVRLVGINLEVVDHGSRLLESIIISASSCILPFPSQWLASPLLSSSLFFNFSSSNFSSLLFSSFFLSSHILYIVISCFLHFLLLPLFFSLSFSSLPLSLPFVILPSPFLLAASPSHHPYQPTPHSIPVPSHPHHPYTPTPTPSCHPYQHPALTFESLAPHEIPKLLNSRLISSLPPFFGLAKRGMGRRRGEKDEKAEQGR